MGGMEMGGSGSATSAPPEIPEEAEFNATDVGFAQGMIPHHAQAIEMADMALEVSEDPDVRRLAEAIRAAQDPEIDLLTTWLETWEQPVPEASGGHGMDGMGSMMSGMMSPADMERLGGSSGPDFDRMWLEMMVRHHEGAIEMAQAEIDGGEYQPAIDLAGTIVTTQQAEIDEMRGLLAARGS
jgi:uncharacterized protein (DUF305 family)